MSTFVNPYQIYFLIAYSIVFLSGVFVCSLAVWNRRGYPPFAAKQLTPICLSFVAATFWCIGRMFMMGIFGFDGIFSECQFWKYIMQCTMGVNSYLAILMFRLQRLYFVIVLKKERVGFYYWGPILIPLGISCILTLVPYILSVPSKYSPIDMYCVEKNSIYSTLIYVNVFGQAVYILLLNYKLFQIRKALNEVRLQFT